MALCAVVSQAAPDFDPEDPVLDAARATVLDFGVRRTTVSEVARRAGVSRMTVYRRHPDGAALLRALMAREFGGVLEQAEHETAWLGTGRERLVASAIRGVDLLATTPCSCGSSSSTPSGCCPTSSARRGASSGSPTRCCASGWRRARRRARCATASRSGWPPPSSSRCAASCWPPAGWTPRSAPRPARARAHARLLPAPVGCTPPASCVTLRQEVSQCSPFLTAARREADLAALADGDRRRARRRRRGHRRGRRARRRHARAVGRAASSAATSPTAPAAGAPSSSTAACATSRTGEVARRLGVRPRARDPARPHRAAPRPRAAVRGAAARRPSAPLEAAGTSAACGSATRCARPRARSRRALPPLAPRSAPTRRAGSRPALAPRRPARRAALLGRPARGRRAAGRRRSPAPPPRTARASSPTRRVDRARRATAPTRATSCTGDGLRVRARHVVNATGVWAGELQPAVRAAPEPRRAPARRAPSGSATRARRSACRCPASAAALRLRPAARPTGSCSSASPTSRTTAPPPDAPASRAPRRTRLLGRGSARARASRSTATTSSAATPACARCSPARPRRTADLSRRHALVEERRPACSPSSAASSRPTGAMAQDAVDRVAARPGVAAGPCRTTRLPLVGARPARPAGAPRAARAPLRRRGRRGRRARRRRPDAARAGRARRARAAASSSLCAVGTRARSTPTTCSTAAPARPRAGVGGGGPRGGRAPRARADRRTRSQHDARALTTRGCSAAQRQPSRLLRMAATPAAHRMRVPRPHRAPGRCQPSPAGALGTAALGVAVGLCGAIALAAAERPSFLSGPARHGFPAWMVGPLAGLVPGLTRHPDGAAEGLHGRARSYSARRGCRHAVRSSLPRRSRLGGGRPPPAAAWCSGRRSR